MSTRATKTAADPPSFTLDDLREVIEHVKRGGPVLGAVLVIPWWGRSGTSIEITVDEVTDEGRRALVGFIGKEGVDLLVRHRGQKVLALPACDFDRLPTNRTADASAIFAARVYRLTTPPDPFADWFTSTEFPRGETDARASTGTEG